MKISTKSKARIKRISLLIISIFILQISQAQNLVPNGDFENYSALPNSLGLWSDCNTWSNAGGTGSPDYWHTSGTGGTQLPNSQFATLDPQSGDAVMGFFVMDNSYDEYREYLQIQLSSPMVVGETYNISFWLTNGFSDHTKGWGANRFGIRLTESQINQTDDEPMGGIPQIEISGEIWETAWKEYTFSYTADAAYNYITIGNFYNDASTSISEYLPATNDDAYYYIDNIVIELQPEPEVCGMSKRGNIWYFGENAGLDFNSGSPVPLTDGQFNNIEGTATVCDENGSLLFYTDGITVWTNDHSIMENGTDLNGHYSSAQCGLSIPKPGSTSEYYIFTTDGWGNNPANGFQYSIADMSFNGGLGKITTKNVALAAPSTEQLTAVRHVNGEDYWIIVHEGGTNTNGSNKFLTYLLTSTGVNPVPVESAVGAFHRSSTQAYMKASVNGSKLACIIDWSNNYPDDSFQVFDFNNADGTISNPMTFLNPKPGSISNDMYGIEFSPDGSRLYISNWYTYYTAGHTVEIFQYDLDADYPPATAQIIGTSVPATADVNEYFGAIQLAPDGKMYIPSSNKTGLSVIENPNGLDVACNFSLYSQSLAGKKGTNGLPNFTPDIFICGSSIAAQYFCEGSNTRFYLSTNQEIDSYSWNFDDPASGAANTSTLPNPEHVFSATGNYSVVLDYTISGSPKQITYNVSITPPDLIAAFDTDTVIVCGDLSYHLNPNAAGAETYYWNTDETSSEIDVTVSGEYSVVINAKTCPSYDTIQVVFEADIDPLIWGNTCIYDDEPVTLSVTAPDGNPYAGATYLWTPTNETTQQITVNNSGTYTVTVSIGTCVDKIVSKNMYFHPLSLPTDTILCTGEEITLEITDPAASYIDWYRRFPNPRIHFEQPAITLSETTSIWLTVDFSDGCYYFNRWVRVEFEDPAPLELGADLCAEENEDITILGVDETVTPEIIWSTGEITEDITVTTDGQYSVMVREDEDHCWAKDTINIDFYNLDLGEDHIVCKGDAININLDAGTDFETYEWLPSGGSQDITATTTGEYSVIATHQFGCVAKDTVKINYAPNQSNHAMNWYFGDQAGITFNTADGEPIALTNSAMEAFEGCSTFSDENGDLLFYTNGVTVWNKNHAIMQNGSGLLGDMSSTQSSIIIKQPGNANIYYLFTTDAISTSNGFNYSVIDVSLQNGLGEVTIKNQLLSNTSTEKVTASLHSDNSAIWIIGHELSNNNYTAYLLDETGLNTTPVVSSIGSNNGGLVAQGQMTSSPDSKRLVNALKDKIEIFDFNQTTGQFSNLITLEGNGICSSYGIEFSPTSRFLYSQQCFGLFQYDLHAGDTQAILDSRVQLSSTFLRSLHLGPNGKLYGAIFNETHICAVNFPDRKGTDCEFIENAVSLSGRISNSGLNNIAGFYFSKASFSAENFCIGSETEFTLLANGTEVSQISWDFGDGNSSSEINPTNIFTVTGTYTVTITIGEDCPYSIEKEIEIFELPTISLGNDIVVCENETVILDAGSGFETYLWSDNSTEQTLTITETGTYSITITNENECKNSDEISVTINSLPEIDLGDDIVACENETIILDAGSGFDNYLWSDNSTEQTLTITETGTYSVTITNENECKNSDEILVTINSLPEINLGDDIVVCENETVILDAGSGFDNYLWSDNSTEQTLTITESGTYSVTITNENDCSNTDEIIVTLNSLPEIDLGDDIDVCENETVILDAGSGFETYLWSDNSTEQTLTITETGTYSVTITNENECENSDEILVTINSLPEINLGDDIVVCENETVILDAGSGFDNYLWSDNSTEQTLTITESGTYSVTIINENDCSNTDEILVTINSLPEINLGDDIVVCENETVILDAGSGFDNYLWSDNSTEQTLTITETGTYSVTITNENECENTDEILVTINLLPEIDLGDDIVVCENETIILDAGSSFETYLWSDNSTEQTLTITESGTYSVTITNENECKNTDEINVTINSLPEIDLGEDIQSCENETVILDAGSGFETYLWSDNSTEQTLTITETGTYSITITDANNCENSDEILVTLNFLPEISLGEDIDICENSSILLTISGDTGQYLWSNNSTENEITVDESGEYWVRVGSQSCFNTDTIKVDIILLPKISLNDTTVCENSILKIGVDSLYDAYEWNTGETENEIEITETGEYSLEISINKCKMLLSCYIDYDVCDYNFFIPNGITPNGDGYNDTWILDGLKNPEVFIYNRWGNIVYYSNDYKNDWNGDNRPSGAYFYVIKLEDGTIYKGDLNILN